MKKSNAEDLVKRVFGMRVPETVYNALRDLDKAENDLMEATENHSVQACHYTRIDQEKADLFDMLIDDGMIVIGYIPNRYEERK